MIEPTRKLAAIVFTDIVGFTKLTAKDQSKASALLRQQRKTFQPIVNDHKGDWVKEVGDGLILTFDTITDAVNCCIKLQNISKNIDDLVLRIGIHLGEILIEENDIIDGKIFPLLYSHEKRNQLLSSAKLKFQCQKGVETSAKKKTLLNRVLRWGFGIKIGVVIWHWNFNLALDSNLHKLPPQPDSLQPCSANFDTRHSTSEAWKTLR